VKQDARSSSVEGGFGPAVGPGSATWVRYYDRASRRRHRMGGYRRLRAEAKKRRRVQWIVGAVTAIGVAVLTSIFYVILAHQS
jgi:hypothetical protein